MYSTKDPLVAVVGWVLRFGSVGPEGSDLNPWFRRQIAAAGDFRVYSISYTGIGAYR